MTLRQRIQLLFAGMFCLLLVAMGLDMGIQRSSDRISRRIDQQIVPAREDLAGLLTDLVDQETGQRGYLLTGNEAFLAPYQSGQRQAAASILRLQSLLTDEPDDLAGVDRIHSRITAWQQLAADFEIQAERSGRAEVVRALVASGTGRRLFDELRDEIGAARAALDARLAREQHRLDVLHHRQSLVRLARLLAAVIVLAGAARLVIGWITNPLDRLARAVRAAASGALREPIPPTGPPELAALAADIDGMRQRLLAEIDDATRARAALADRGMIIVTLRDELCAADVVLPRGLSLAGRFRPAKGLVAGDWYDVIRIDDDRAVIALIDVSGHGAEVATFALRTKALTMAVAGDGDPGDALGWLASRLGETGELFLTGVIIEITVSTGQIRYASAGHPPLLLAGVTGVEELPATGPLLGPLPGTWTTSVAQLDRGGVLVAYSDGLIEARDGHGEMFGIDRLSHLVAEQQLAGVDAVADAAIQGVERFATADRDDITLCVLAR